MLINELKSEIINLFESDEMKECITECYDELHFLTKSDIIKGSRIDIQKKLELLKKLYESIEKSEDWEIDRLKSDINEYERAIGHMCGIFGDVYIVGEYGFDDNIKDEKLYGYCPYTSFHKALRYIKSKWEDAKESYDDDSLPTYWYTIEKYSSDDLGEMHEQIRWYITADGTVTSFTGSGKISDINIPHPFGEGDIVIMDSAPSFPERIGLIIEIGPKDSCFPQALYLSKDGFFKANSVKSATVFSDYSQLPLFSPMYRLKTYKSKLSDDIKIFEKISNALKNQGNTSAYQSLGNILWENLYNADKVGNGVTASRLNDIFEGSLYEWYSKEFSG